MQHTRRARAVAIAKTEDAQRTFRLRLMVLSLSAVAALLSVLAIS